MEFIKRRWRRFLIIICNVLFRGTRFFGVKRTLLNMAGIKVGDGTKVVCPIKVSNCSQIEIGEECWIGSEFTVLGDGKVFIGDRCDFAPEVALITGGHQIGDRKRRAGKGELYSIKVQDGCWIGAKATLLGNIIIESSAVIGACSLVNKNVRTCSLVAGVPAKKIKEI